MSCVNGEKPSRSTVGQRDIEAILRRNEESDLLRIATAGGVDDGKSTLIGRLLYESKASTKDQAFLHTRLFPAPTAGGSSTTRWSGRD